MNILVTSTSFASIQGKHIDLLQSIDCDLSIMAGPLRASQLVDIVGKYDGIIAGDDEFTFDVLQKGKQGRLKAIAKYGNGLDSFDLKAAEDLGILIRNCGGGNGSTVAEHVFALLLSYLKNITNNSNDTKNGRWIRPVNVSLHGKKMGVIGAGAVGLKVIDLAKAFGCKVCYYDLNAITDNKENVVRCSTLEELFSTCDIVSLHLPLNIHTKHLIDARLLDHGDNLILVNTARGGIVHERDLLTALEAKKVGVYLTDVLHQEPLDNTSLLYRRRDVVITSHCGSRTKENIENQGLEAVQNLINMLYNEK